MAMDTLKQMELKIGGSRFALTGSIWMLVLVLGFIGWQAERRISALERGMMWTQLVLRQKFPATSKLVDDAISEKDVIEEQYGADQ